MQSYNVVKTLLTVYPDCRLLINANKELPLHLAIRAGCLSIIQLLLQLDVEKQIRESDKDDMTPLHLAAQQGFIELNFKINLKNKILIRRFNYHRKISLLSLKQCFFLCFLIFYM